MPAMNMPRCIECARSARPSVRRPSVRPSPVVELTRANPEEWISEPAERHGPLCLRGSVKRSQSRHPLVLLALPSLLPPPPPRPVPFPFPSPLPFPFPFPTTPAVLSHLRPRPRPQRPARPRGHHAARIDAERPLQARARGPPPDRRVHRWGWGPTRPG